MGNHAAMIDFIAKLRKESSEGEFWCIVSYGWRHAEFRMQGHSGAMRRIKSAPYKLTLSRKTWETFFPWACKTTSRISAGYPEFFALVFFSRITSAMIDTAISSGVSCFYVEAYRCVRLSIYCCNLEFLTSHVRKNRTPNNQSRPFSLPLWMAACYQSTRRWHLWTLQALWRRSQYFPP